MITKLVHSAMWLRLLLGVLLLNSAKATCPTGTVYESVFNKCYKFVNERVSFLTAEGQCQSMGGHLVALSNAFENAYVSGIVNALGASTSYWIGANLLFATNWTWTSNENFLFTNWATGQPSDPSMKQCAAVRDVDNLWTKEMCNSLIPFVCATNASEATEQPSPPSTCAPSETGSYSCKGLYCSAGYQLFPGTCRCYKYYQFTTTNYSSAETMCSNDNGKLAKITSTELNDFLYSIRNGSPWPWIGLKCPSTSISGCYWPDGSNANGYSNFAPGSPNGRQASVYLDNRKTWTSDISDSGGAALCERAPIAVR